MRITEILGMGVIDRDANTLGKVADFDINTSSWTINSLIVKSGIIKKSTIGIDKIDKIGDKVLLKVTKGELGK